jgi:hypothetical protein
MSPSNHRRCISNDRAADEPIAKNRRQFALAKPGQPNPVVVADWSHRFDDPIPMPAGGVIRTIGEAAAYAISRPKKVRNTESWQRAARVLHQAAEYGGPFVFMARINFCRALHGDTPPPIGNPEGKKGLSWGKRKLVRGG